MPLIWLSTFFDCWRWRGFYSLNPSLPKQPSPISRFFINAPLADSDGLPYHAAPAPALTGLAGFRCRGGLAVTFSSKHGKHGIA